MIVGKDFIWMHFPKTAGHAVDSALKTAFRGAGDLSCDDRDFEGWHDSLPDRVRRDPSLQVSGKAVISGFRRLPNWLLSRVHYEASRPPYLSADRAMLCRGEFFQQNGLVGKADDYALHFSDSTVDRWIRTEHLAEDFERQFGDILPHQLMRAAVRKLRRVVNGTRLNYIRSLDFFFTPAELSALYEANPVWATVERALYGDILRLSERRYFLNRNMRFVAASEAALQFWGKSVADVIGKHLLEVFPAAKDSTPYIACKHALRASQLIELKAVSPTFDVPVQIRLQPDQTGLQVNFDVLAA